MKNIKNGISLIVLVITIIIMIILAAAVIISLQNAGIIKTAHNAVCMTNIKQAQNLAVLVWSELYTDPDSKYTVDDIKEKIKEEFTKNKLNADDYEISVTTGGVEVKSKAGCVDVSEGTGGNSGNTTPASNWEYAYSYDNTADTWTAFKTNEGTEPTGDINVRMYKNGTRDIEGMTVDTFDMIVSGTGDLNFYDVDEIIEWGGEGSEIPVQMLTVNLEVQEGITSIGENSFLGMESAPNMGFLKSVKLPNSLKTIGEGAFAFQGNLERIEFGTGLEKIDEAAFDSCISLKELNIPNGVREIGYRAFTYCFGLEKIIIPETTTKISMSAFAHCTALKEIILPNNLTTLEATGYYDRITEGAFEGCTSLTKVTISSKLQSWRNAFRNCTSLTEVVVAEGVTEIADYSFYGCTALKTVSLPSTLKTIGANSFKECTSIQSITIPSSVTQIYGTAFEYCTGLKSFIVPPNITELGQYFLKGCTSLEEVYIPVTVTKIGWQSFYDCNSLKTVKYGGNETQWNAIEGKDNVESTVTKLYNQTAN